MKIFIAEDEPLAAAKLKLFLEKLGEGQDISIFSDGESLFTALNDGKQPDLLFMDIQMPRFTGLDVLSKLPERHFPIILTTAYDRYAIDGFNYGVADYLLKPYTLERLKQALQKAKMIAQITTVDRPAQEKEEADRKTIIIIRSEGQNQLVEISAIDCLEADKDYTLIHLTDGRQLSTLGTLSSLEQQLPADSFVRIQRSYVVNLNKVKSYTAQSVTLQSGLSVPVGKIYRDTFMTALQAVNV